MLSYGLALLASMIVALTVTPALALIALRTRAFERQQAPVARLLQAGYTRVLLAHAQLGQAGDRRRGAVW